MSRGVHLYECRVDLYEWRGGSLFMSVWVDLYEWRGQISMSGGEDLYEWKGRFL